MNTLQWKLIVRLSLFGLAMAIATVFWISAGIEPLFWLAIFLACAYIIAKKCSGRFFLHGFLVSMVNSIWITCTHIILFESYLASHSEEASMMSGSPFAGSPRLMMAITGPVIGAVSGLVLGLLAFLASKLLRKAPVPTQLA
jgi:hypothetical protein